MPTLKNVKWKVLSVVLTSVISVAMYYTLPSGKVPAYIWGVLSGAVMMTVAFLCLLQEMHEERQRYIEKNYPFVTKK